MAASTASMCRSSDSDFVHSESRVQASSRESCTDMAVTLADRSGPTAARASRTPASLGGARRGALATAGHIPMEKFIIEGGVPLSGTVTPAGNKNGALPILAACLLTDDEVILRNVPRISDVEAMLELIAGLGATVEPLGPGQVRIDASTVDRTEVDRGLAERIRASFLLAG